MPQITPRNLLYDAYRTLGVLRSGQATSDDAMDDGLRALNDLVDAWHCERLMIYSIVPSTYALTAPPYTLGPGGTLGTVRPQRIEGAGLLYPGSAIESPLPVLTLNEFRQGRTGVYISSAYPLSTLSILPANTTGQLVLYGWVPFARFTSLDVPVDFPSGYARALRWNLALELAPMARIAVKIPDPLYQNIQAQAAESKGWVKSFNSSFSTPVMDASDGGALGCGCGYNVYTDGY
jgi:hypothetical protein